MLTGSILNRDILPSDLADDLCEAVSERGCWRKYAHGDYCSVTVASSGSDLIHHCSLKQMHQMYIFLFSLIKKC